MKYDISVLVLSYNPDWEKLRKTVVSILKQVNINLQIVITDDGSNENYFERIKELFSEYKFSNYSLTSLHANGGTCKNVLNGLYEVESDYVKLISPGDYIYEENTLFLWLENIKKNDADISFGDVICYQKKQGDYAVVQIDCRPQNTGIYMQDKYRYKDVYLNYLFLDDSMYGSEILSKTGLLKDTLKKMISFLKYAEDMTYRTMILDRKKVSYFAQPVIWYEYGTGISSSKNSNWHKILMKEKADTYEYLAKNNNEKGLNKIRLRLGFGILKQDKMNFLKYIVFPELIPLKVKKDKIGAKTLVNGNVDYLEKL